MIWVLWLVAMTALALLAAACFKIGNWHSREADYWSDVAWRVRLEPNLDEHYRPILRWTQAHRPSLRGRLAPWQDPEDRMGEREQATP